MANISISISGKMLEELNDIEREMGFSGRSEAIRAGVRMLLADVREKKALTGRVKGVLLLIHDHVAEDFVTKLKHNFLDVIYTQLHNRFREDRCLELFILDGEADRIRELTNSLQRSGKIEYVKLIIA
ncbi:MAG: CopG family ribbon-helix-helix protein [Candidatus Bathyarchaeia archaeon]